MTWFAAIIPGLVTTAATKPWQSQATDDTAPQVERPDYTPLLVVGIIGLALIILMVVILSKKA